MIRTPPQTLDTRSTSRDAESPQTPRRRVLEGLGLLVAAPWLARAGFAEAQTAPSSAPLRLPLHLEQLVNHIGTSVPDVTRSATFYSRLFDGSRISGQEKPALRYEISFYPGALSIGPLRTDSGETHAQPYIDHFCVVASPFDAAAWRARLGEEKVRYFAQGSFVDIGGVSVQLLGGHEPAAARKAPPAGKPPPGGGFKPMPPLYTGRPLVKAHGFEQVTLHVSNLDASAARFRQLFGLTPHDSSADRVVFGLGGVRLALRPAAGGERPVIAAFAIRVAPFDHGRIGSELESLGARVEPVERAGKRTVLRFADPDGIHCELWTI